MPQLRSVLSVLLLLLIHLLHHPLQAQTPQDSVRIAQQIDSLFARWKGLSTPGASVAVVRDGRIIYKNGYGSANLEYDIPITPSTIFHVASVSKQFTVFSILLLAEEGKLSLDDDIRKYIPEVPDFGQTITLRHLATHTSGLRDQWNLLAMAGWRLDDVITKEHVLKLVSKQKELNFSPGEEFLYCNTGFTLLAEVVARVAGQSFAEFTKAHIFDPLTMTNTLFYDDHEKVVKNRAYSYYFTPNVYKKSVLSYANVGATSLFTTAEDLSLWALNFESAAVGSFDIIKQMNTQAVLNNGDTIDGALGQFVGKHKGLNQIQHGGADAGYRSHLVRFPDQDFSVVVLSNYAAIYPSRIALQIADLYLEVHYPDPDALAPKKEHKEKYKKLSAKQLQNFASNYWNDAGIYSRKVYVKDDTLRYFRGPGNESALAPLSKNEFQMLNEDVDVKVKFEIKNYNKEMIVRIAGGEPIVSIAYDTVNYTTEKLQELTGTYYSDELSTSYTFEIKNNKLVATHMRLDDIALEPIKADTFSGNQWFFNHIQFVRDDDQSVTGVKVSGGRVRNLWFEKRKNP